jgi:hypothetical protein
MGDSRLVKKIRAAMRLLISPAPPLDSGRRYPVRIRYAVLIVAGILFLEWYYFGVQVSYDSIPGKPIFWLAMVGWAMPGVITEWAYRKLPSKRLIDKYGNWMIGVGLTMIGVSILSKKIEFAVPVAYAIVPGFLAGALIGSDSLLVWNLIKKMRSRKKELPTENPAGFIPPEQQSQD